MIVNIHGFGGCGENTKFMWLKANFPDAKIYSPTFDYLNTSPSAIFEQLGDAVRNALTMGEPVQAIGTSWGGFFAYCLNATYKIPVVLCNPALNPHLIRANLDMEINISRIIPYLELYQSCAFRHDPKCCDAIIGTLDKVIAHEFLTVPMFRENPECLHRFPFGHDFDIQNEHGVQEIITNMVQYIK